MEGTHGQMEFLGHPDWSRGHVDRAHHDALRLPRDSHSRPHRVARKSCCSAPALLPRTLTARDRRRLSSSTAQPYLVDFGAGVVRRAKSAVVDRGIAALEPVNLRVAFVTHLHSDHTVGYADLILTPWVLGRRVPLEVYGPSGIKSMTGAPARSVQCRLRGPPKGPRALHSRCVSRRPCGERARNKGGRRLQGCQRHRDGLRDETVRWRAMDIGSTQPTAAS